MKFNELKRKLHYLIERIKLSETEYISIKNKSRMYDDMMSTVKCTFNAEFEEVKKDGYVLKRFPTKKNVNIDIDMKQMLSNGGINLDRSVDLKIIGLD